MPVDIEAIRDRVRKGKYLLRGRVIRHALKEEFDRSNVEQAILNGRIIERYPKEQRTLICGKTTLPGHVDVYLHVICEHADSVWLEIVTAYIPDEPLWETPPVRRRKAKKR
jgi:hypothetical protein